MSSEMKARKGFTADEEIVAKLLGEGEIIHLALRDGAGPFSVPVNYGFMNGKIYIHSSRHGRKIAALRKGELVSFSVLLSHEIVEDENPCNWGCNFRSVVGTGVPRVMETGEKVGALECLMQQYSDRKWDFNPDSLKAVEVVEIMVATAGARVMEKA